MKPPRIGADLVEYLEKNFPPKCITPGEDIRVHERYAGKVDLARNLIRLARKDDDFDIEYQGD